MLNGYTKLTASERGNITVSFSKNGIFLSTMATRKLLISNKVNFLFNHETCALAIQTAGNDEKGALDFKPILQHGQPYVRFSNRGLLYEICKAMKWDVSENNYRANGIVQTEDSAIIFDLYTAKISKRRAKHG